MSHPNVETKLHVNFTFMTPDNGSAFAITIQTQQGILKRLNKNLPSLCQHSAVVNI